MARRYYQKILKENTLPYIVFNKLGFLWIILTPQIYQQFVTQCIDNENGK